MLTYEILRETDQSLSDPREPSGLHSFDYFSPPICHTAYGYIIWQSCLCPLRASSTRSLRKWVRSNMEGQYILNRVINHTWKWTKINWVTNIFDLELMRLSIQKVIIVIFGKHIRISNNNNSKYPTVSSVANTTPAHNWYIAIYRWCLYGMRNSTVRIRIS